MARRLRLKIISPREVVFEDEVSSVSSVNSQGKFDILPEHANFLTIVDNQPIRVILTDKSIRDFMFAQAIIFLENGQVLVFADPKSLDIASKII